jgi:uncharacterized protein (UPF0548 family)
MLRRPSPADLARLVDAESTSDLTYLEVGTTASAGAEPAGYRHDRWVADLGSFSADQFADASAALAQWHVQRGATLSPPGEP